MTDFRRVFVDTSPIIYYLENNALYSSKIKDFFESCLNDGVQIVTSAITVEEYLVFPYANKEPGLIANFKRFIEYMGIEIIDIDSQAAELAARLRGQYRHFKAMDSLQIAAALSGRCDMFFTNDKQLRQEKELPCMTVEDL